MFGTPDETLALVFDILLLKLINYSCSSYPTRASYSGHVDGFRTANEKRVENTAVFEIISNTAVFEHPCLK